MSLNSNCTGGCGPGSPMEKWLKADLAAHPHRCLLAYWHHPRFFSPAIELWLGIGFAFASFFAGRFAVKRLILHPNPPEVELL